MKTTFALVALACLIASTEAFAPMATRAVGKKPAAAAKKVLKKKAAPVKKAAKKIVKKAARAAPKAIKAPVSTLE